MDAIEQFAGFADEPNGDAGALPVWFLSQMTRRTATVALSGEGADEFFGGYETYRANILARRMRWLPSPILKLGAGIASLWPVSDEKIGFEYKLKRFLAGCRLRPEQAHVFWNGTFSDRQKQGLVKEKLPDALAGMLRELAGAGGQTAAYLWFDQKYYLPDDILAKVDRMSMAHSIELRPPFLDHRVVEFAASLPERLKIQRHPAKARSAGFNEGPPAPIGPGTQEDWLRYSCPRMAARSAAAAAGADACGRHCQPPRLVR